MDDRLESSSCSFILFSHCKKSFTCVGQITYDYINWNILNIPLFSLHTRCVKIFCAGIVFLNFLRNWVNGSPLITRQQNPLNFICWQWSFCADVSYAWSLTGNILYLIHASIILHYFKQSFSWVAGYSFSPYWTVYFYYVYHICPRNQEISMSQVNKYLCRGVYPPGWIFF